jgi:AbrB family transcriptional regulator (stage V sporulation protein T)
MRATGIVRKTDDLGRITLPKELRDGLRIEFGTALEIFTNDNGEIILRKYLAGGCCPECGDYGVKLVGKSRICVPCAEKLAKGNQ